MCGVPLGPAARRAVPGVGAPPVPLVGGRYRIERQLGTGAFGRALLATDTLLRRSCVVKQLRLDTTAPALHPHVIAAFDQEARLLVRLNTPGHPNIPEIYEYLPDERCLVMKYITGESLQHLLKRRLDPLPEETALAYARDVCSALAYMHGRAPEPVLHRDLKPANILCDSEGRIWLVDFGLARPYAPQGTGEAADASGTPGYTPPEQWQGRAAPQSDIYALGATLFEMLTLQRPAGEPSQLTLTLRRAAPRLSADTERLLHRTLAGDSRRRPTAPELLTLLDRLIFRMSIPQPPPPEAPPANPGLLGRQLELGLIAGRLTAGRPVLVVGMAGVGKTALLGEILRRAAAPGEPFYHACLADAGADGLIYRLAAYLARHEEPGPWEHLQRARLRDDREHLARTLVDMLLAALRRAAIDPAPTICLDDAHVLATEPAAGPLLAGLRRLAADGRVRLLVASREALPPFPEPELCRLDGLGVDAAADLLASRGLRLDPRLAMELHRATDGNAQFLVLASDLLARREDAQTVVAGLAATPDVERYLLAEIDGGLSPEERHVMQAVAVLMEPDGTRDAVEHLVGTSARRALRALSDRQLILQRGGEPQRHYQHSLVRAFYAELPSRPARARLHRLAAGYFQDVEPDSLAAAYHLLYLGELAAAADLLVAGGRDALNRGRLTQLRRLLEQLPAENLDPRRSVAVLVARGEAQSFGGDSAAARTSLLAALGSLDQGADMPWYSTLTASVCRGLAGVLEHESPEAAMPWVARGLAVLRGADPVEEALLLHRAGSLHLAMGNFDTAEGVLTSALAGLPAEMLDRRADVLINLGISFCARGHRADGVRRLAEALDLYRRTGNSWGEGTAYQNLGIDCDYAGDWGGAAAYYEQALACARVTGNVVRQSHLALLLGTLAIQRGDDAQAEAHLRDCILLAAEHRLHEYHAMALSSLGELQIAQGADEAAAMTLAEAEALAGTLGERFHQLPEIYRGQALVLAESSPEQAEQKARAALDLAVAQDEPREIGKSRRVLGQVLVAAGRLDEATPLFDAAAQLLDEHDPYEAARARLAWSAALEQRDPRCAAELRAAAQATFARLGAKRELALADPSAPPKASRVSPVRCG
jgi:tetratricopeptide (TPR) repeat protein